MTINIIFNVEPTKVPIIDDITGAFNNISRISKGFEGFSIVSTIYDIISLVTALKIGASVANIGSFPIIGTAAGIGAGLASFTTMEFFLRNLLPYLLIFTIIIVAILFTLFRVLFMLIVSFVSVLLDVIFAPIWILAGLIPGNSSMGFGPWIRDIAANLAVFPAVYVMLLLAKTLGSVLSDKQTGFAPPLLGNPLAEDFLAAIVGLGLFLMTPQAAKITKSAFKAPKLDLGGIGQGIGVGRAVASAVGGTVWSRMYYRDPRTGQVGGVVGSGFQDLQRWAGKRARQSRLSRFMPVERDQEGKPITPTSFKRNFRKGIREKGLKFLFSRDRQEPVSGPTPTQGTNQNQGDQGEQGGTGTPPPATPPTQVGPMP